VLSPERIVMGGGVMTQPELLPLVRSAVTELMNGYLDQTSQGRHSFTVTAVGALLLHSPQ
jgi:hypothetical protein